MRSLGEMWRRWRNTYRAGKISGMLLGFTFVAVQSCVQIWWALEKSFDDAGAMMMMLSVPVLCLWFLWFRLRIRLEPPWLEIGLWKRIVVFDLRDPDVSISIIRGVVKVQVESTGEVVKAVGFEGEKGGQGLSCGRKLDRFARRLLSVVVPGGARLVYERQDSFFERMFPFWKRWRRGRRASKGWS